MNDNLSKEKIKKVFEGDSNFLLHFLEEKNPTTEQIESMTIFISAEKDTINSFYAQIPGNKIPPFYKKIDKLYKEKSKILDDLENYITENFKSYEQEIENGDTKTSDSTLSEENTGSEINEHLKKVYAEAKEEHINILSDNLQKNHASNLPLSHQTTIDNDKSYVFLLYYTPDVEEYDFVFYKHLKEPDNTENDLDYRYKVNETEIFRKPKDAIEHYGEKLPFFVNRPDLPKNMDDCKDEYFLYLGKVRPLDSRVVPSDFVEIVQDNDYNKVIFNRPLDKDEIAQYGLEPKFHSESVDKLKESLHTGHYKEYDLSMAKINEQDKDVKNEESSYKYTIDDVPDKLKTGLEQMYANRTAFNPQESKSKIIEIYLDEIIQDKIETVNRDLKQHKKENLSENDEYTTIKLLDIDNIADMKKIKTMQKSEIRSNVTYLYYEIWGEDNNGEKYHFDEVGPAKFLTNPTKSVDPAKVKEDAKKERKGLKIYKDEMVYCLNTVMKKIKEENKEQSGQKRIGRPPKNSKQKENDNSIESLCKENFGTSMVSNIVQDHIDTGMSQDEAIHKVEQKVGELQENVISNILKDNEKYKLFENAVKIKKKQDIQRITGSKGKNLLYYITTEDKNKNVSYITKTEPQYFITSDLEGQKEARQNATNEANLYLVAFRNLKEFPIEQIMNNNQDNKNLAEQNIENQDDEERMATQNH